MKVTSRSNAVDDAPSLHSAQTVANTMEPTCRPRLRCQDTPFAPPVHITMAQCPDKEDDTPFFRKGYN